MREWLSQCSWVGGAPQGVEQPVRIFAKRKRSIKRTECQKPLCHVLELPERRSEMTHDHSRDWVNVLGAAAKIKKSEE